MRVFAGQNKLNITQNGFNIISKYYNPYNGSIVPITTHLLDQMDSGSTGNPTNNESVLAVTHYYPEENVYFSISILTNAS